MNGVEGSYPPVGVLPGYRAPDVLIHKQGFRRLPIRLYEATKYNGRFHVLVFAGEARDTRSLLKKLRSQVDELTITLQHAIAFRTIVQGSEIVFEEHLGVRQFGDAYWDVDGSAHGRYKARANEGAVVVLRPDGILGFVSPLDGFDKVAEYLNRVVVAREQPKIVSKGVNGDVGQMIVPQENNLYYQQAKEQGLPSSMEQGSVGANSA